MHLHRQNAAEQAIQTFKAKFIICICSDNPRYTEKEWDCLLPQANLTINLLRNYRFNPKLSGHVALHGTLDYNKAPLSPIGTIALVHEKNTNWRTWSPCGTNGWYIGPDLEHYRCVECYIPPTHRILIADIVEFISTVITILKTN